MRIHGGITPQIQNKPKSKYKKLAEFCKLFQDFLQDFRGFHCVFAPCVTDGFGPTVGPAPGPVKLFWDSR